MKREETMCPILTAAIIASDARSCTVSCDPKRCMWAMRKTAMGEDGRYRTVGYRCAMATGSDRYVDLKQ